MPKRDPAGNRVARYSARRPTAAEGSDLMARQLRNALYDGVLAKERDVLRSMKNMTGFAVQARDGCVGHIVEFLFEEERWTVRYCVADAPSWRLHRKALIAAKFFGIPERGVFPVHLTKDQIRRGPSVDEGDRAARRYEAILRRYCNWPVHWHYGYGLGLPPPPPVAGELPALSFELLAKESEGDSHLHSTEELRGYHALATDGDIGHVEDFFVEDAGWVLCFVVLNTRNLLPGKRASLPVETIHDIDWDARTIILSVDRGQVLEERNDGASGRTSGKK